MRKMSCSWAFLLLVSPILLASHGLSEPESSIIAPMEEAEQEALYLVLQDLVGKWWNGSELYPDPCGWTQIQGVSCDLFDGLWYVTSLNIGPIFDNSLRCSQQARFNPLLFQLKHLRSLSFFNCFSRHQQIIIPSSNWKKLSGSLKTLEFRSNRGLVGGIPDDIVQLSELESLVIVENSMDGELPTELGKLEHLKRLMLSGNHFVGRIPNSICVSSTELLIMDLSRNLLTGPLPPCLRNLTSLLKLDLSDNRFDGSLPPELGRLENLTLLDLRNNNFSGGLARSLNGMASIQDLLLAHNPNLGGSLEETEWGNLRELTTLDFSHAGLTGAIPEAMAALKKLRYVALDGNGLTGSVSPEFASLPCLGALYLNGNDFTGRLEFPQEFYQRLGKRFAPWGNPNLCYDIAETAEIIPYGVAQCKQDHQELFSYAARARARTEIWMTILCSWALFRVWLCFF
ncbi:piriformospora indica-insensitive protein 2-like [Zingiber officinale]|uniref:piriformospora indica-insensitive protein 2-like n=1 Tax=Zingiber officinale TaxID=94328 RepID=UPI001C4D0A4B|nr:piriformospora indica-insensitive protein 2-like [Zingiber officinale]XP_042473068.1 piriformospora indica-insensitive protein 2-like [Zingiber officinale]